MFIRIKTKVTEIDLTLFTIRSKHSTATALLKIFNDELLEFDERNVVFLTLLYLSAANVTVDHTILLNRPRHTYGYSGMAL